ncbi:MAG: hypothetical protein SGJ13_16730 [Actinomycetota bacterium]|nr:hypothetical protein [Actinomycetota bacterium]
MTNDSPSVWCPSCGAEYRPGSTQCADCRVALVSYKPSALTSGGEGGSDEESLVELGEWSRLQAQILRRRLESAGVAVMIEWSSTEGDATGVLIVSDEHSEFAWSVVNEVTPEEEEPDTSPHAYVARIEDQLSSAATLLEQLRTRLDSLEAEGKL